MGFLSTLFNPPRSGDLPQHDTSILDWGNEPLTHVMLPADLATAIELINESATQTVKTNGLPVDWFSFETVAVKDSEKTYFQLQILMNHWDIQMCAHSYAFECAVIKCIRKKNKGIGRALRAVLWRVAPDAGCPFDEMPDPSYWDPQALAQRELLRQRIQREFYAVTTPESGAKVTPPVARVGVLRPSPPPGSRALAPAMENLGYSETHPHNLSGFSITHSHAKSSAHKRFNSQSL